MNASQHPRCESHDCNNPAVWKKMLDATLTSELMNWKSQAELREIQAEVGLVEDAYTPSLPGWPSATHDEKRCALQALMLKNEQAYRDKCFSNHAIQAPHNRPVYSRYCAEHTCRFFYSVGGCNFKKPRHDMVCNNHAICSICPPDRFKCKEQYMDPQHGDTSHCKFLRHEYCSDHICSEPNCEMLRDQVSPGIYVGFCIRHRCYYKDCDKQSIGKGGYCVKHKCQFQNCSKISVSGFALCTKHVECGQSGCSKPRGVLQEGRNGVTDKDRADGTVEAYAKRLYLLFCTEHGMCAESSCNGGLRLKGAMHCRKHACIERGCFRSHKDKYKYCETHRCKEPNCHSARAWSKSLSAHEELRSTREEFCSAHLCREGSCSEGIGSMHLYCEAHECYKPGCVSQLSGDGLCHEHAILENTEMTKQVAKAESQDWVRLLHHLDYSVASHTSSPVLGASGFQGLPRSSAPYRLQPGRLPKGRPPTPETSVSSEFDDLEDEGRGRQENRDGPRRPFIGSVSNNINNNSGKGNVPPVNGQPPQQMNAPVNKQQPQQQQPPQQQRPQPQPQPPNGQGIQAVRMSWQMPEP